MSEGTKAVFLSYASQDSEAAKRICDALRAAGVEVWFDAEGGLETGDVWDAKIRRQIKECVLFLPVISAHTQEREEGYFRIEWDLAAERARGIASGVPFILPIVIDDTREPSALVPDRFRTVQWTRARDGELTPETRAKFAKLWSHRSGLAKHRTANANGSEGSRPAANQSPAPRSIGRWVALGLAGLAVGLIAIFATRRADHSVRAPGRSEAAASASAAPAKAPLSEARQLARRAEAMSVEKYNSTSDDFATAEGLIKRALELEQNDAEIWAISSMLNTNIRTRGFDNARIRRELARRDAERALKLDPNSPAALFASGRAQRDIDPAAAEATFRRLLSMNPEHAGAMAQLSWIYDNDGRIEEAIKLHDRVLELDPTGAPLNLYVRFLTFFHYSRFAEAEQAIRRSVELEPAANSCAGLVMLLLTAKDGVEESARVLAAVPEAIRNEPRIIWVEATAQLHRRDPEAVLRTLGRLPAEYIQDNWFAGPKAYFAGFAHAIAGRNEAARVAWQSALAIVDTRLKEMPDSPTLHLSRGQLLARLGQADEARREIRVLDEMSEGRDSGLWVNSTVLIHAALGDADAALPMLEKLLAVDTKKNVGWRLTRVLLRNDPRWDRLRADPRFQKLCEEPKPAPATAPLSPARALVAKATPLHENLDAATHADFELAGEMFKQALELAPLDAEVWANYSWYCNNVYGMGVDRTKERETEIKRAADRAIKLDPKSDMARFSWANYYRRQPATLDEAIRILRELTQGNPDNKGAMLRVLAGAVGRGKGNLEEGLAILDQAIALPGGDAHAWVIKGDYYWSMSRPADSEAAYDRSLATKTTPRVLTRKASFLMYQHGDLAGAEKLLTHLSGEFLQEDRAVAVLSQLALWQGKPERCLDVIARFPRDYIEEGNYGYLSGPKSLPAGYAYWLQGKPDLARLEWEEGLRVADQRLLTRRSDLPLNRQKAELLALLGRRAEAETVLRLIEQLDPPSGRRSRALIDVWTGNMDACIEALRVMERSPALLRSLRYEPQWEPLRRDPGFETLLKEPEAKKE